MFVRNAVGALATALLVISGSVAYAADMPVKAQRMTPVHAWTWNGLYVGANVGYAWNNSSASPFSSRNDGVIGGGQIGYNWQWNSPLVVGVEADIQASGQHQTNAGTIGGVAFSVDQRSRYFGTLRARLGYAAGPWLFYVTGGYAYVDDRLSVTSGAVTATSNSTRSAGTVGLGTEWMFAPAWSAKLEYLYIGGGSGNSVTVAGNTFNDRIRENVVRVGLNYHF